MLVVTTTVGMVDGVHGNTTSLGPAVALDSELVLGTRGLCCGVSNQIYTNSNLVEHTKEGLVGTTATSDDTDHTTGAGLDDLLGTRGELDTGLALVRVVADNGDVVAGGAAESSTVTDLLLDICDDGTLGHLTDGKDVADSQGSALADVDELASVHALVGDEGLGDLLELVGVAELDTSEGSTTTCKQSNVSPMFPCSCCVPFS